MLVGNAEWQVNKYMKQLYKISVDTNGYMKTSKAGVLPSNARWRRRDCSLLLLSVLCRGEMWWMALLTFPHGYNICISLAMLEKLVAFWAASCAKLPLYFLLPSHLGGWLLQRHVLPSGQHCCLQLSGVRCLQQHTEAVGPVEAWGCIPCTGTGGCGSCQHSGRVHLRRHRHACWPGEDQAANADADADIQHR